MKGCFLVSMFFRSCETAVGILGNVKAPDAFISDLCVEFSVAIFVKCKDIYMTYQKKKKV